MTCETARIVIHRLVMVGPYCQNNKGKKTIPWLTRHMVGLGAN